MAKTINYYNSVTASDDFVGARVFETHVDFYFPYGFVVDTEDVAQCKTDALRLLSVVALAAKAGANREYSFDSQEEKQKYPLNSFIWVISDYMENGLYTSMMKTYKSGQYGKINWKRTFRKQSLSAGEGFVYLEPVLEVKTKTDNVLTEIHNYCLQVAAEQIGWLFGLSASVGAVDISESRKLYYERALLRELSVSFDDRKKILINHLLRIVRSVLGKQMFAGRFEIGTYEFHYAWEYMIQAVYGNLPLGEFFPQARWCINGETRKSSALRPDTVMAVGGGFGGFVSEGDFGGSEGDFSGSEGGFGGSAETLYIIDAKYYKYGVTRSFGDLPNSNSIQKQITYGDHAKLKHGERFGRIMNMFVLPFDGGGKRMEYVGYAESDWRENDDAHQKVHCVLLDTRYLMELYFGFGGERGDWQRRELAEMVKTR